jgi:hypothetical protein
MLLVTALGLSQPALSAQGQPQAPTASAASTAPKAPAIRVPDALVNPVTPDEVGEPAPTPETPTQPFDPAAYRAAVKRANAAVAEQDWPNAAKSLEEVLALKPDSREAAYNLGVARFQQGDFAGARTMFQQSAQSASADLAARSMYNEGNSIYADAVRNLPPIEAAAQQGQPPQASSVPPEELQKAVQQVEQAFTHFKDAAAANPGDEDSAANAETSLKLLKELRKIQQQQQQQKQDQQKQDQQQQQDPQQDSKDEQQQQDQQQQSQQQKQDSKQRDSKSSESQQSQTDSKSAQGDQQQQQQEQQPQEQQQQQQTESRNDQKPEPKQDSAQQKDGRPDTEQDRKKESDSKDPQQRAEQQQPQPSKQQQQQQQQPANANNDPNAKQGDAQTAEVSNDRLDQTQADRLLQLVRDKEKSRNAQRKAEQARTRPTPVDRDW